MATRGEQTGNDAAGQAGSAAGGPILGAVLGGMHLGELYSRVVRGTPQIGNRRREELLAAGVKIIKPPGGGESSYVLPDIPGTARNESDYTNTNARVIAYYRQWVAAGRPSLLTRIPPKPPTPDTMPPTTGSVGVGVLPNVPPFLVNVGRVLPGVGSVASRILGGIIAYGLFFPSSTSATDTIYGQARARPRATPGGRTRGRRGRRALPRPRPVAIPKPRTGTPKILSNRRVRSPAQVIEDIQLGGGIQPPLAIPSSSTSSAPSSSTSSVPYPTTAGQGAWPYPSTSSPFPSSAPAAAPPATASPWVKWGQLVAPYLMPFLSPGVSSQPMRFTQPATQPQLQPDPLTQFQTSALPYAATQAQTKDCSCAKPKKRRKKGCTNPVTSRTHKTRGGRKFVTVTRRIECQASSRKKPASARASRTTTSSAARLLNTFALPQL